MSARTVVFSVFVLVGVGTVIALKSLDFAGDSTSVEAQTVPVTVDADSRLETRQEQPAEDPFSRQQVGDDEELGRALPEGQLSPDEELLASELIAEMQGARPTPLQPWFVRMVREYVQEGIDPNWSATTENQIYLTIAAVPEIAAANLDVQCRATMCRLQITHPPSERSSPEMTGATVLEIVEQSGLMPLWMGATRDEFGNPISQAYLKRGERDTTKPLDIKIVTNP